LRNRRTLPSFVSRRSFPRAIGLAGTNISSSQIKRKELERS
jgi:hypothetical protein